MFYHLQSEKQLDKHFKLYLYIIFVLNKNKWYSNHSTTETKEFLICIYLKLRWHFQLYTTKVLRNTVNLNIVPHNKANHDKESSLFPGSKLTYIQRSINLNHPINRTRR